MCTCNTGYVNILHTIFGHMLLTIPVEVQTVFAVEAFAVFLASELLPTTNAYKEMMLINTYYITFLIIYRKGIHNKLEFA